MSLKELITNYDAATAIVEEKKLDLEKAVAARSDIVRLISAEISPSKKFLRSGKELTIVVRGETFFLRGAKTSAGLVDVDA
jgi:hypothetical protein